MGQYIRGKRSNLFLAPAAAIVVAASALAPDAAIAQQKPAPQPASQGDPAKPAQAAGAAKAAFESGVKSYQAGKQEPAISQISEALRLGGLPVNDMARALYIRGLAYKKQNKPGLAISDLTSALWLKNGLSEADRQTAMAERAEAYKLAGLGEGAAAIDVASDPGQSRSAPPVAVVEPEPTSPALTLVDPAAPAPAVTRQDPTSAAAREAAEARRIAAAPVEDSAGLQTFGEPPAPRAAPVAEAAPPSLGALPTDAPATSPQVALPSGVSNFFSNLFSGTSQSPPPAALAPAEPSVTTASTSPLVESSGAATSGWQQTAVIPAPAPQPSRAAPIPAPQAPKKAAAPKGKYKLHIAAVRSRAEAEMLAQKLAQSNGADLASRTPTVDEAVIGSMGTFYRVRVGGYQNPEEPRGVCNKIRTSGFDCLVVTN